MATTAASSIAPERWPSEEPLFVISLLVGLALWVLLLVTIVGGIYALGIGLVLALAHVVMMAQIRGSAVRLGPQQFPELHAAVVRIAQRMGMAKSPDAYVMQSGGVLNAFATRFLLSDVVVLYSGLLEACGDNEGARDMIIGHELAHVKLGHLRWRWLLAPSMLVPFLGYALSRAREYSCDRFGAAAAGDPEQAALGLCILAAGPRLGPRVNRMALVQQREQMNTGFMALGEWLATHPPLSRRLAAIQPALTAGRRIPPTGPIRAVAAIVLVYLVFGGIAWFAFGRLARSMREVTRAAGSRASARVLLPPDSIRAATARQDMAALAEFVMQEKVNGPGLPASREVLYRRWAEAHPGDVAANDPFAQQSYDYALRPDGHWFLRSIGPDRKPGTADDIVINSR